MGPMRSFLGLFVLMALAWGVSTNRRRIPWRVVFWGTSLQLIFAVFIFIIPVGGTFFLAVNRFVSALLESAMAGTTFLFGPLALPPGVVGDNGEVSPGFILAFQSLPTAVFFASLMGLLYHIRVMPLLIRLFSKVFTTLMRISGAESLCAASNIFVGAESALTIRPYLSAMTRSELCTILTAAMATIASTVLGLYVMILRDAFPNIAGHLVSASILSAPAAVVMSKLMLPEEDKPKTLGRNATPGDKRASSWMEAAIDGAMAGVKLVVGIAALLLAFLGLLHLADLGIGWAGGWINGWTGWTMDWSLAHLISYAFYPLTWLIGVVPADVGVCARLIGERTVITEIPAYQELAGLISSGAFQDPRSIVITTYALCGFTHVASLAIFVGGISALAPDRTKDLAAIGPRALLAAILATLMTGAVAGIFASGGTILAGS
ncbi:MAG: nucleoside transporter [Candidatus Eisenbacteria bacterium]|uniref:Nucleoside transporter n=1 Tax=Eiseniibacteriota bacterium TaxID=2212470 RepID=A0A948RZ15_UNCEI|nr:nucleoside transporter [Candidatus Eisenbacteria bacterium]MBU1948355.1 nucleoside transporter [Candidatus Eisenbacteria bacterium]MBU2692248.1 nucleoside transporter [Candidatus Eisenbacteria bacterium]